MMIEREQRKAFTEQMRRRRGRPRSAAPAVQTSVKIPTGVYDAICRQAFQERQSVHRTIQEALQAFVRSVA